MKFCEEVLYCDVVVCDGCAECVVGWSDLCWAAASAPDWLAGLLVADLPAALPASSASLPTHLPSRALPPPASPHLRTQPTTTGGPASRAKKADTRILLLRSNKCAWRAAGRRAGRTGRERGQVTAGYTR